MAQLHDEVQQLRACNTAADSAVDIDSHPSGRRGGRSGGGSLGSSRRDGSNSKRPSSHYALERRRARATASSTAPAIAPAVEDMFGVPRGAEPSTQSLRHGAISPHAGRRAQRTAAGAHPQRTAAHPRRATPSSSAAAASHASPHPLRPFRLHHRTRALASPPRGASGVASPAVLTVPSWPRALPLARATTGECTTCGQRTCAAFVPWARGWGSDDALGGGFPVGENDTRPLLCQQCGCPSAAHVDCSNATVDRTDAVGARRRGGATAPAQQPADTGGAGACACAAEGWRRAAAGRAVAYGPACASACAPACTACSEADSSATEEMREMGEMNNEDEPWWPRRGASAVAAGSITSARSRSRSRREGSSASDDSGGDESDVTLQRDARDERDAAPESDATLHEARAVLFRLATFYESAAVQTEVHQAIEAFGRGSARHLEVTRRAYRRALHHVLPAFGLDRDAAPAVFEAILRRHAHDQTCLQRFHDINRLLRLRT